jgi:hypothetical protein
MSRKDDVKAHDGQVTVNVDDFTRTRESVSLSLVFLQKWFCEDAAAPPKTGGGFGIPRPPTPAHAHADRRVSKQTTCTHSIYLPYLPINHLCSERRVKSACQFDLDMF